MSKVVSLTVKCPHCDASFMEEGHLINNKPSIRLLIHTKIGQKGYIWLSSIYGDYNFTSEFRIEEGEIVEFYCPHCGVMVEVEYLPPGHPITHDIELDLNRLKARDLEKPQK